jgi:hypothetical protein
VSEETCFGGGGRNVAHHLLGICTRFEPFLGFLGSKSPRTPIPEVRFREDTLPEGSEKLIHPLMHRQSGIDVAYSSLREVSHSPRDQPPK